ncbi:sensitivity to red-light reduced protein [Podila verticillata]|nr:sensitivity to red-light reduced protein [Podila verticillata]KAF9388748.1 sensitivity to red-light reduced protein [Podila verticillata]
MCSTTSTSPLLPEQYLNKALNMSSASSINSISPPSSPPSPTMSMASINGDISEQPRKIKVMIIDDNAINLTILSRLLNKHFADTIQLTSVMDSGVSALDQLSKDQVDLILMDIDMPVLSGVQTTTAIRSSDNHDILAQNKNVPIIAVTTSDAEEQRELYRQVGMADCVSKPIALPKLRMAIESAMKTIPSLSTG